jgi:hypothetical protein
MSISRHSNWAGHSTRRGGSTFKDGAVCRPAKSISLVPCGKSAEQMFIFSFTFSSTI